MDSRMQRAFYLFILTFFQLSLFAQKESVPATYSYKGKNYFVYPVRGTNINGIPPTGIKLPDGEYVVFTEFAFSNSGRLRDTSKVAALFSLKSNLPEGRASFYLYEFKNSGKPARKAVAEINGQYHAGLREGEWKTSYKYGSSEIKNYDNGLLDGWSLDYSRKGRLIRKMKYRSERLCDTVFYFYSNGQLQLTYDVYDPLFEKETQPPENFADRFLRSDYRYNVIGSENSVKSFYKEYREDGKLRNNIQFTNGRNPRFDTLYFGAEKLVLKELNDSVHYVVESYTDSPLETGYSRKLFSGDVVIAETTVMRNKKTRKTDTLINDFSAVEFLNTDSWQKTYAGMIKKGGKTRRYFLVPAAQYYWEEMNGKQQAVKVDSLNGIIIRTDSFHYSPLDLYRVRETTFRVNEPNRLFKQTATMEKLSFLQGFNNDRIKNYFNDEVRVYAILAPPLMQQYCRDYTGQETSIRYYKNNLPVNEKIVLTSSKKLAGKMLSGVPGMYTNKINPVAWVMELKDGEKNGKQEMAENMRVLENTNNFLKQFFFFRKNGQHYTVAEYRNGLLHGDFKEYTSRSFNTGKYNRDSSKVKFTSQVFAWCESEQQYENGRLHGEYKTFYETGKPHLHVQFSNGKINGTYECFDRYGTLLYRFYCKNDTLDSCYQAFSPVTRRKTHEAWFKQNRLDSFYVELSRESGIPLIRIEAKNNIMLSRRLYYDDGKIKEEMTCDSSSRAEFVQAYAGLEVYSALKKRKGSYYGDKNLSAYYKSYYETGKLLSEGQIRNGLPYGAWKFYNNTGASASSVYFKDTLVSLSRSMKPVLFIAAITSYFNNGKMRCKGFVKEWEGGYDCVTQSDKTRFGIYYTDTWTYSGEPVIVNGNGSGRIYDENGVILAEGTFKDFVEEGLWKYYDANGKLNEIGQFIHGEKDGLWYSGDLENVNFETGACFDLNSEAARQQYEYGKNTLKFTVEIYKRGALVSSEYFESNLNRVD